MQEQRADETENGVLVRANRCDVGAPLDLARGLTGSAKPEVSRLCAEIDPICSGHTAECLRVSTDRPCKRQTTRIAYPTIEARNGIDGSSYDGCACGRFFDCHLCACRCGHAGERTV